MGNQKWVFLKALIVTLIVFDIGIYLGYMLENSRVDEINKWYLEAEMEILDQTIQKDALDLMDLDCRTLEEENIMFGDKIFKEALEIDKIEKASRIVESINFQHKRYDLLRTLFWMNSIRIKEKCKSEFHTVVYLYQYNEPSLEQKSKQRFFSKLLQELKEIYGNKILLIPIAADNDLASINLLTKKFEINELPVILIDEKTKITDVESLEDFEKYLN